MRPSGTSEAHTRSPSASTPPAMRVLNGPGRDHVDVDAVRRELERGMAGHADHRRLAGGIAVTDERLGGQTGGRRGHDDAPRALRLHHGRGRAHRVEHAVLVDREHALVDLVGDRVQLLAAGHAEAGDGGDAGVRERDVEAPVGRDRAGEGARRTAAGSETSTTAERTSPPRPASSAVTCARRSPSMSASVTRAPLSASTSANAWPMPLAAPVTSARAPCTSNSRLAGFLMGGAPPLS